MCGIIGFIDKKGLLSLDEKKSVAHKMLDKISHRGGDHSAYFIKDNIVIGHTRLSILDSSLNASQPMGDSDFTLSYNGEIYNHDLLRSIYLSDIDFKSHSDTVTLFELLHKYPIEDVYHDLWGMFAFCIYNKKEDNISLVVDSFGIKPLYYFENENWFAWSSEIKVFKELPGVTLSLNKKGLYEYLIFRYLCGEETLIQGIYRVMPNQKISYALSEKKIQKSFFEKRTTKVNTSTLEDVLEKSVQAHLSSDMVPGVQLSGGVDSSLIAYFAQKNSREKIHTFSIGMEENEWNEFKYSDQVVSQLHTNHHKLTFSGVDFVKNLDRVIYFLDEPLVHPNTVPLYLLAQEARKFTKVLLTGEGADESFLGYKRYQDPSKDILFSNAFAQPTVVERILKKEFRTGLELRKNMISNLSEATSIQESKAAYDVKTYLPHLLLRQDRAGMAANIESRVPFLYPTLVDFSHRLSLEDRFSTLGGKDCIKRIAAKYFPEGLVLRKKCGFGLPVHVWLKDNTLLGKEVEGLKNWKCIKQYFSTREIKKLIEENSNGVDHSAILFTLISFCRWHQLFID